MVDQNWSYLFVAHTSTGRELVQKELIVNRAAQNLLKQRMETAREYLQILAGQEPKNSQLLTQVKVDHIELAELCAREILLMQQLLEIL